MISKQRELAYDAIDGERDYQNSQWGATGSGNQEGAGRRSVDEFALYITEYAAQLRQTATRTPDSEPAAVLHIVRKIAALAVWCMEQHGAPKRKS